MRDLFNETKKIDVPSLIALRTIFTNSSLIRLIQAGLSKEDIFNLSFDELRSFRFRDKDKYINDLDQINQKIMGSSDLIEWCEEEDIKIISIFDEIYPERFLSIKTPPVLLFCKGNENLLNELFSVCVVGTREPSNLGLEITSKIASFFAKEKINIISGLAMGIDEAAHKAAISVSGQTTAVLVDIKNISPSRNKKLAQDIILNNGLLFSENIPGSTKGESFLYLDRNRLQSALSSSLFLIESSLKSGTATTCRHALEQKRKIYCPNLSSVNSSDFNDGLANELLKKNQAEKITSKDYPRILKLIKNVG